MTKKELYQKLFAELDRSLIVDEKTRDYWLKNYQTLPIPTVEFFCDQLIKMNRHVDAMIAAGIDADPQLAEEILLKGKAAKKKFLKLSEKQSVGEENAEEFLKTSLS